MKLRLRDFLSTLPAALVSAFSYDRKVLLERHVAGRDLAISIVDGQVLPIVEAVPHDEDFYDFAARYTIGRTTFACPAVLGDAETARAQELAGEVWDLLGCRGFARVDLMYDEDAGELYVLEVNAVPGLTETSLLPLAADAADMGFDDFVARVVGLALSAGATA